MKKIALLVGARPNYMKVAPLRRAIRLDQSGLVPVIIHTGQHYDREMSDVFFDDLEMHEPDVMLDVGSGTHAQQTGRAMIELEPALMGIASDVLVVVGDVNSTLAGALTAAKLGIPVAHVEAGLRSFDRTMPEEINRIMTDSISNVLFTSCRDADDNLTREGIAREKIHFVGNIMIDSLVRVLPLLNSSGILEKLNIEKGKYICVTMHRPANVDDEDALSEILAGIENVSRSMSVVFSMHPRTRKIVEKMGWKSGGDSLKMIGALGYIDFMQLMTNSSLVVTDSGGIQEETTYLGIPCLTVRPNTERPVTISQGTNRLIKPGREDIVRAVQIAVEQSGAPAPAIELWDGKTAGRILEVLKKM